VQAAHEGQRRQSRQASRGISRTGHAESFANGVGHDGFAIVSAACGIAAAAGGIPESAFEMFLYALLSALYSACVLLWGELRLDKNGFQATLFRHRQHLWTEVGDFRAGYYSCVQFNVGRPRLINSDTMSNTLGDNYGLKAEELADLMEVWRSAALNGQGDERPLFPAVSE
jgi:hypothetical protein